MENRDIASLLELSLDLKASRCGDILEVDAAERTGYLVYCLYDRIHVMGLDAKRECVYIAERLEENALALHYRHSCLRSDISESEDSRTVSDYSAGIPASCKFIAHLRISLDLKTRLCNSRSICQRQIIIIIHRHSRNDLYLTVQLLVQFL